MQVDGRVVGRALSAVIKPALRDLGFHKFQGRHSWRRNELTVDLVTFPSMNAYIADGAGCTSFSFGCEAGVYYPALADERGPIEWPRGWDLTFRGFPHKTIRQPIFHPWGTVPEGDEAWRKDRADTWYVLEDGSNLDEVTNDALGVVLAQAIPFIDLNDDPVAAIDALRSPAQRGDALVRQHKQDFGELEVFVAKIGSPAHVKLTEALSGLIASLP